MFALYYFHSYFKSSVHFLYFSLKVQNCNMLTNILMSIFKVVMSIFKVVTKNITSVTYIYIYIY